MTITHESTFLDDQNRALRLPPDLLHRTNILLDENSDLHIENDRLRAELDRQHAAQAAEQAKASLHAQRMRQGRTAWIEAHIEDVIRAKRPALISTPRCGWTSILMRHYTLRGIAAPDVETVRRVVKDFNGF